MSTRPLSDHINRHLPPTGIGCDLVYSTDSHEPTGNRLTQ